MKSALLLLLLTASGLHAQESQPSGVRVPDAATALKIAEPALIKVYGKRHIESEKPLTTQLVDGTWKVYGTLWCTDKNGRRTYTNTCYGGVAALQTPSERRQDPVHLS